MAWIDKLERKFWKIGIPNLMLFIVIGNILVFIFDLLFLAQGGTAFSNYLYFSPQLVLSGQVWRVITFIFIYPEASIFLMAIVLYFYYFIGSTLENEWGSFRFTAYYLVGIICTVAGGFISYLVFGQDFSIGSSYLNLSLFFTFATLFPNSEMRLFFIIPIKAKYLAYVNAGFFLISIITQPLASKISAIMAIANYLIFCGPDMFNKLRFYLKARKNRREFNRKMNGTWNQ